MKRRTRLIDLANERLNYCDYLRKQGRITYQTMEVIVHNFRYEPDKAAEAMRLFSAARYDELNKLSEEIGGRP